MKENSIHSLLAILAGASLGLIFIQMAGSGITTVDDAIRQLSVRESGFFSEAWGIADSSGRLTLYFHFLLTHVPYISVDERFTDILLVSSHILVVYLFTRALKAFFGIGNPLLFTVVFFSLLPNGWEHNLYASYPFAFHFAMSCLLLESLSVLAYIKTGNVSFLVVASILALFAAATYELFIAFSMIPVFYYVFTRTLKISNIHTLHGKYLIRLKYSAIAIGLLISAYCLAYFYFKVFVFEGRYAGTEVSWDLGASVQTMWSFIVGASPGTFAIIKSGALIREESIFDVLRWAFTNASINNYFIATVVSIYVGHSLLKQESFSLVESHASSIGWCLVLATFAVLLPSISGKYQEWVLVHNVIYYSASSYIASLFLTAVIILLLSWLKSSVLGSIFNRIFVISTVGFCFFSIVLVNQLYSSEISKEQFEAKARWAQIDSIFGSTEIDKLPERSKILAPQSLFLTTGIVHLPQYYWEKYILATYGIRYELTSDLNIFLQGEGERFELVESHDTLNYELSLKRYESKLDLSIRKTRGFFGLEYDQDGNQFEWSDKNSVLEICNTQFEEREAEISFITVTDGAKDNPLVVCYFDICVDSLLSPEFTEVKLATAFKPGCTEVEIKTEAKRVEAPDIRALYFQVRNLEIATILDES